MNASIRTSMDPGLYAICIDLHHPDTRLYDLSLIHI